MNRWNDWWSESKKDLEHAQESLKIQHLNWACFAAHQAAEKALKALHMTRNAVAWGHSVRELLRELTDQPPDGLLEGAKLLDKYYVGSRYPNAHPAGAPWELYTEAEARQAIVIADEIIGYVAACLED